MSSVRILLLNTRQKIRTMGESLSKHLPAGTKYLHSDRTKWNGNESFRENDCPENDTVFVTPIHSLENVQNVNGNENNANANNNNRGSDGGKHSFDPRKIKVDINAYIEDKETAIEELSPIFLKYRTPSFKADAAILVPEMKTAEHWKIGWIQACHKMKFVNIYGKLGMTSWEFPELNRGLKMLSDSDGVHFPWYGNRHEVQAVKGPTKGSKTFNVRMSDSFSPQITWVPPNGDKFIQGDCLLTEIHRDQSFHSWVVARNEETREVVPLKTVIWRMQININVDPSKPLGERGELAGPFQQIQPEVLTHVEPVPLNALDPPHANAAQMLLWRPSRGRVGVVIAPKWVGAPPLTEKDIQNPFIYGS